MPWRRFLQQKLSLAQLFTQFPVFYRTRKLITIFTTAWLTLFTPLHTSPLSLSCTINCHPSPYYTPPHCRSAALSTVTLHPTTHLPNCHSAALSTFTLQPTTHLPTVAQLHNQLSFFTPLHTSPLSLSCTKNCHSPPHYTPPVTQLHYQLSLFTPLHTCPLSLSCTINCHSSLNYTSCHCHSAALTTVILHPTKHLPTVTQLHYQLSLFSQLHTLPLSLSCTINCHSSPH